MPPYEIPSSVARRRPRRPQGNPLATALGARTGSSAARPFGARTDPGGDSTAVTPRTPAAPVAAPGVNTPTATPAAAGGATGFDTDPILQQIRALGQRSVAGAEAAEIAGRKQTLIGFGYDPTLAALYPDQSTAEAARQNPFSIVAELGRQHTERGRDLNENLNQRNLFYSGHRAKALGDEQHQYLGEQVGAQQNLQAHLGELSTAVLAAKQAQAEREVEAQQAAYERAIEQGLFATSGVDDATAAAATAPAAAAATPGAAPGDLVTRAATAAGRGVAAATRRRSTASRPAAPTGYAPSGIAYATARRRRRPAAPTGYAPGGTTYRR